MIRLELTGREDPGISGEPVRWQHADRSISQLNERVAAPRRRQDRGECGVQAVELDAAAQLEPIDAGVDFQGDRTRGSIDATVGFDAPPLQREAADDCRQHAVGEIETRRTRLPICQQAETDRLEPGNGLALERVIAAIRRASFAIEGRGGLRPRLDLTRSVGKPQRRLEAIGRCGIANTRARRPSPDPKRGSWYDGLHLESQFVR